VAALSEARRARTRHRRRLAVAARLHALRLLGASFALWRAHHLAAR
jgi:hypothetical protein